MSERTISVMLMDDHNIVREGLRALLERQPDIRVVAEAGSVAEALAADLEPDVVVADLVLPDERGAEVVRRLRERFGRSAILVLSMIDNPADVQLCLTSGAKGYLMKEAAGTELVDAVRAAIWRTVRQQFRRPVTVPAARVWVRTDTGSFYCRGSVLFGSGPGRLLAQEEALTLGYQPATGSYCPADPAGPALSAHNTAR